MAPDEYYTGFVAEYYDLLVPEDEAKSYGFFRSVVEQQGLDSSSDMLDRCRGKASELGVSVALHQQRMESFEIPRAFRTIYCVSSSFMLLPSDGAAGSALASIHRHLQPGGRLLLALHLPGDFSEVSRTEWRVARESERPSDGSTVRCSSRLVDVDHEARTYETLFRYELITGRRITHREDRSFLLHWYTREILAELLAAAGYVGVGLVRGNGKPSQPDDRAFIVSALRAQREARSKIGRHDTGPPLPRW